MVGFCADIAKNNPGKLACAEIAVGAVMAVMGAKTAAAEVALMIAPQWKIPASIGAAGIGGLMGSMIGGIGLAAGGTAIGIPAAAVTIGLTVVAGMTGYTAADIAQKLMASPDFITLGFGAGLAGVGIALMYHGTERLLGVEEVQKFVSTVCETTSSILLKLGSMTIEAVKVGADYVDHFLEKIGINSALFAASAVAGVSLASTTLGSSSVFSAGLLGLSTPSIGSALSSGTAALGLSAGAPLVPIVAGVVLTAAAYKAFKRFRNS